MKIITFGTLKGGVGKTMLCFNIGGLLSQLGYHVLIIDSDLQGNLTNNIGLDRTARDLITLYDVYNTTQPAPNPADLIVPTPNPRLANLDIIPSSIFLHRAELGLSGVAGRELVLRAYLEDNRSVFASYDYLLIDTNPSMSVINQNAFVVSDSILLVADVSMNALEGAQLFIALWEESRRRIGFQDNIGGLIINDVDVRNRLSADFLEYLGEAEEVRDLRELMLSNVIPRTVRITESELAAVPISLYDPNSKGCAAISALVEELFAKGIL